MGDGKPTASRACVKAPLWLLAFSAQRHYPILPVSKTTAYLEPLHSTTGEALRVTWAAGRAVLCVRVSDIEGERVSCAVPEHCRRFITSQMRSETAICLRTV